MFNGLEYSILQYLLVKVYINCIQSLATDVKAHLKSRKTTVKIFLKQKARSHEINTPPLQFAATLCYILAFLSPTVNGEWLYCVFGPGLYMEM